VCEETERKEGYERGRREYETAICKNDVASHNGAKVASPKYIE
jgi:hypothetical protein